MIDLLINLNRIKYDILDDLFKDIEMGDKEVHLYIDFHTIISRLYRNSNNSDIINYNDDNTRLMVVNVLNMIGHYRRYIFKRLKRSNKIYIVFNRKIPSYQSSYISYGKMFFDRYSKMNKDYSSINMIIDKAVPYIKDMCQYFEWLYFIDNDGIEDTVAIQYLIDSGITDNAFNIVLTNNDIMYQLTKNDNTIILYPKRDSSKIITKDNLIDFILSDRKYRAKYVNYKLYPMILTIAGVKSRDIPPMNIRGITKLIKIIDMMIDKELITNDTSAKSFIGVICRLSPTSDDGEELLMGRYKAISPTIGVKALTQSQVKLIESSIIDLYDQNGLEKLNDFLGDKGIDIYDLNKNKIQRKVIW